MMYPSLIRAVLRSSAAVIALASAASAQSIDRTRQLFDQARYAEARTELVALQRAKVRSAAAAYYLGRIAVVEVDGEEAVRQFERAVRLEEGNALYHFWLGSALRDAVPLASRARQPQMAQRARAAWERAVELDPDQLDARFDLVQFYAVTPGFMGGGMERAREQVVEIARRNPMRGALALAVIAQVEKDATAEEAAYRQAIEAAPDSAAGYFALTDLYARLGRAADALATLDDYRARRPDDRWALYQAGRLAGATGQRLDRGAETLQQFLVAPPLDAHAPAIARAYYWLGQIAERRGAPDAAREHYLTALKINPRGQASIRALEALP